MGVLNQQIFNVCLVGFNVLFTIFHLNDVEVHAGSYCDILQWHNTTCGHIILPVVI